MKSILVSILAAALLCRAAPSSSPSVSPFTCLKRFVCAEPNQHDDNVPGCNCADKFCPRPVEPAEVVYGWNEATNACGIVLPGEQCAGLDVTCNEGFTYGWNGVDTCKCNPDATTKRAPSPLKITCRIACISPSIHDANAIPTSCNCDKKVCKPISGPGGLNIPVGDVYAFNATSRNCGPVPDPDAECKSLGVGCVTGYNYGWSFEDSACESHDNNANPQTCNCADRVCDALAKCAPGLTFAWNQAENSCGCVIDSEFQCLETKETCINGFIYGWSVSDKKCKCLSF